jgi:hypothetical protein
MSQRLQVLLDEEEFSEVRRAARASRVSVAEWVRQALRVARRDRSQADVEAKLAAIRRAAKYRAPTADIQQMNAEIASGLLAEP